MAEWKPLDLDEALRARAGEALAAIDRSLEAPSLAAAECSFSRGWAGLAVYQAYRSRALGEGREGPHRALALAFLERAAASLGAGPMVPWLFEGYTGLAWAVEHLTAMGLLEDEEDFNEGIDEALLALVQESDWRGRHEYMSGLSGFGAYALERGARGRAPELLARVLERLEQDALATPEGLSWFQPPEILDPVVLAIFPQGWFNLGLAHGVPGILAFLAEAAGRGEARAAALVDAAAPWLLAQREPHPNGSCYGKGFGPGEPRNPEGTRLGWCFGDLGVAMALLLAARKRGRADWEREALGLALDCARRADPREGIVDAPLCHGAFGAAHLFLRLRNATGDARFGDAARDFLAWGLEMRRGDGLAGGFRFYHPAGDADPWRPNLGLLEGAAGIGLALLAATGSVAPAWDRALLVHGA